MSQTARYDVAFYVPWVGPLLATGHGLSTGGAETQIFLLSQALAQRGLSVCLLVYAIPGVDLPSTLMGMDVVLRPPHNANRRFLGKLQEAVAIRAALASVDADVVVTRVAGPHVGLIGLFARGCRFVFSSASPFDFEFRRIASKRRDRILMAIGLRLADQIVVQTEEQARSCRERLHRDPVLIRSICELPDAKAVTPEAFLWIGRYNDYKRPMEYIELARSMPEARFVMVASAATHTREMARLKQQVEAEAQTLTNLELIHSLPRADLMQLIERAVAVVSTSAFEGMSNVLLEGWARGVPALVFSYDSDNLVAQYQLGFVAEGSRSQLVSHARQLWASRWDRAALSGRCRSYVERHHAPDRIADQWEQALAGKSAARATRAVAIGAGGS